MRIEFTGRHAEVPPEIKRLAERKLAKLARVLPSGIIRAHVIVTTDKHRQIAEVSVHSKHLDLTAEEASSDLGASLSTVIDKLTRRAQHQVGKWRTRKRAGPDRTRLRPPEEQPAELGPRVIRSRRFPLKPMTLDEAALEVGHSPEGFLVFRDAATERVSVLYKRKDGNLGLIEPEA
ncbi:MAG TPA: ribosome-associated translation inhibitor RaiA [Vicinamibacteria bacterium]|jgi:putative sigma-54 modulation protein|nr:ribosome-associated translation inhibitor RaiA [Vicinamibacteria bacterium]